MKKIDQVIELIKNHWTQMAFARDKAGNSISWTDENAVSFCLSGAIHKIYGHDNGPNKVCHATLLNKFCIDKNDCSLTVFNDHDSTTKEDIIELLEEAKVYNILPE